MEPERKIEARPGGTGHDTAIGVFTDDGPWEVDLDALEWRRGLAGVRADLNAALPGLTRARVLPPGSAAGNHAATPRWRARALVRQGAPQRRPVVHRRHFAPPAGGRRAPRADLHQAGTDHLLGRRHLPARARRRVQVVPRRSPRRAVARRRTGSRRGARPSHPLRLRLGGPHAEGRRVHRAGACGHPARRDARRDQDPAPLGGIPGAPGPCDHGLAGAAPGGSHSRRRAGQSARPRRALCRDDHGGARLPPRGGEHARHRHDVRRARPALLRRPPTPPDAGDPAHAGHGTPRRVQLQRRRGHARGRHRHRRGRAGRHDRLPRGLHDARHLPRRPPRGEPVRPAVGEDRAAGLRHHRPAHRGEAPRPPLPPGRRIERRHPDPGRRAARPRCLPRRRRRRAA